MKPQHNEVEPESTRFLASRTGAAPFSPLSELEHLLKVAASVTQDANEVWTEIWSQVKPLAVDSRKAGKQADDGLVPSCGWPEFLEKLWLLKHYLDSVERICTNPRCLATATTMRTRTQVGRPGHVKAGDPGSIVNEEKSCR